MCLMVIKLCLIVSKCSKMFLIMVFSKRVQGCFSLTLAIHQKFKQSVNYWQLLQWYWLVPISVHLSVWQMQQFFEIWVLNRVCHPGGHSCGYWSGTQSFSQINAIHSKIGYPKISSSCSDLTWMKGYQDNSSSNGRHAVCTPVMFRVVLSRFRVPCNECGILTVTCLYSK